tara:strand:- start:30148 stop:31332 length:1185 start_codon:yes stop_codon:yes gene_type:complete
MAAIQGLRGTGQFGTDFRPTNYRELFTLLEPNGTAPLQALLAMTSSESTDDPKYNHFRDELPNRTIVVNGALNNSATSLAFDNDTDDEGFLVKGTVIHNHTTGENLLCTADADTSANTVAISRGFGGSTASAVADNEVLSIAGFADQEGGTAPTAISFDPTVDYNYTQIFKTAVQVTGTLQNTYLRTGDKEQEQLTKALKLHMGDIERAFFFGTRGIANGSTASPTRSTGGLISSITNITDCASATATTNKMTEKEFDKFLIEDIFAYGSNEKIAFAGPRVITNMMEVGKNRWQPTQVDNAYGVAFTRYTTFAGDLLVYMHPMFRQISALSQEMIILDMNHLNYRYMDGRDTQLIRDVQTNDFDGVKHMYMSECGLEMTHSKVHHRIKNWSGLA